MNEIKSFVSRNPVGTEISLFTCHQHRKAALKAAKSYRETKDKPVEIRSQEHETKKVHIPIGRKELILATKNKPG